MTWRGELETLRDLALYSTLEDFHEAACSQTSKGPMPLQLYRTPYTSLLAMVLAAARRPSLIQQALASLRVSCPTVLYSRYVCV